MAEKQSEFDKNTWLREHGNVFLTKTLDFPGNDEIKLIAHVCINEAERVYYTFNLYAFPDGRIVRGKRTGEWFSTYPLRGKKLEIKDGEGGDRKSYLDGKLTGAKLIEKCKAEGYAELYLTST